MSVEAAEVSIKAQLATHVGVVIPLLYSNESVEVANPCAYVHFSRFGNERLTVSGKYKRSSGLMQVNVTYDKGTGTNLINNMAEFIASAFSQDQKYGGARITKEPEVLEGYGVEGDWIVPVRIAYEILD